MRRKAEVLKHLNNKLHITKKQNYVDIVKGTRNKYKTIIIKYLKNLGLFNFFCLIIFFFSKNKANGKIVIKPTRNRAALKVNGPILSIPVS